MSQFMQHRSSTQPGQLAQHGRTVRATYPFSALVGQEEMKLALLLNAVSPQIAGVLVRGEKGTAKSTAARALQALLPEIAVVEHCVFGCDPADGTHLCQSCAELLERERTLTALLRPVRLVELPLGATEDRVLGTLDLERAIKDGVRQFEPGLLAAANRGILYIDEVNLLPDHLVDALLDAAATGVNVVEREGISFTHPANFLLIGTMNPEEGDLRPQLLDRFGLSVEVRGLKDPLLRTEVVKRRIAFETAAVAFCEHWQAAEAQLRAQIQAARQLLPYVDVPENILGLIAYLCTQLDVEGMRADITLYKAATTLAALEGRRSVSEYDVERAALLALPHRRRRQPFEQPGLAQNDLERLINGYHPSEEEQGEHPSSLSQNSGTALPTSPDRGGERTQPTQESSLNGNHSDHNISGQTEQIIPPGTPTAAASLPQTLPKTHHRSESRRSFPSLSQTAHSGPSTPHAQAQGRIVGARHPGRQQPSALALAPTLRAAAPHQQRRQAEHAPDAERRVWLERWDILEPVRQQKRGALILFAVDASGSMAARQRMATAKGAVLALLQRAYQERDHVGLIQFRGGKATLLLPPTNSTDRAFKLLAHLPTGGRTPLASGLRLVLLTLRQAQARGNRQQTMLVLVTDGRANVAVSTSMYADPLEDAMAAAHELRSAGVQTLVIDAEEGPVRLGLASKLAQELGATYVTLAALEATPVANAVSAALGRTRAGPRREQNVSPKLSFFPCDGREDKETWR